MKTILTTDKAWTPFGYAKLDENGNLPYELTSSYLIDSASFDYRINHLTSSILSGSLAGGALTGSYPNPQIVLNSNATQILYNNFGIIGGTSNITWNGGYFNLIDTHLAISDNFQIAFRDNSDSSWRLYRNSTPTFTDFIQNAVLSFLIPNNSNEGFIVGSLAKNFFEVRNDGISRFPGSLIVGNILPSGSANLQVSGGGFFGNTVVGQNATASNEFVTKQQIVSGTIQGSYYGTSTFSSISGKNISFSIAHSSSITPSWANVIANSFDAIDLDYYTINSTYINVYYSICPPIGVNNIKLSWEFKI